VEIKATNASELNVNQRLWSEHLEDLDTGRLIILQEVLERINSPTFLTLFNNTLSVTFLTTANYIHFSMVTLPTLRY
jgi:hypothetical protein